MLENMPLSAPLCQKYRKDKPENKKSGYLQYVCECVCKEWRRWDVGWGCMIMGSFQHEDGMESRELSH